MRLAADYAVALFVFLGLAAVPALVPLKLAVGLSFVVFTGLAGLDTAIGCWVGRHRSRLCVAIPSSVMMVLRYQMVLMNRYAADRQGYLQRMDCYADDDSMPHLLDRFGNSTIR